MGEKAKIEEWYNSISIRQEYCFQEVKGRGIGKGHYLAEEKPEAIIKISINF